MSVNGLLTICGDNKHEEEDEQEKREEEVEKDEVEVVVVGLQRAIAHPWLQIAVQHLVLVAERNSRQQLTEVVLHPPIRNREEAAERRVSCARARTCVCVCVRARA